MKISISFGFTLIELMVTLSVVSVVLAFGVPSFQTLIQNNRMSSKINELVADVNLARSEAIKRGSPVTFCKGNASATDCSTDSSAPWTSGWIVFLDKNGNISVDASTDMVLRVHGALTGLSSLKYNVSLKRINFDADGFTNNIGTFTFCDSRNQPKGLKLANTGRLRSATITETNALVCP